MKRVIIVFSCLLVMLLGNVNNIQASIINRIVSGIYDVVTWPERALVTQIEEEGINVFEIEGDVDDFRPKRGGIKVCKAENQLIIGFYLSSKNVNFYAQEFSDGGRRPIGLELDVIDVLEVFEHEDLESITIRTAQGNSLPAVFYADNHILDQHTAHTIGIINPSLLTPDQWYYATFQFSDHFDAETARFQMQVQLVGDVWGLREDKYENFSYVIKSGLYAWFGSVGYSNIPANNFFNVREPELVFDRDKFFDWPEGVNEGYDRFLWDMDDPDGDGGQRGDYQPYSCSFGDDPWESGGPRVLGASTDGDSSYTYPSGGGDDASNSNPNADGDDVHITHHHIRPYNTGSWHEQIDIDLDPGQSFDLHTQARVENRSSHDLEDVDIDYCVVKDKKDFDIPHSQRKRLDDDKVDIDEGDKENKTMARTRVSISSDFKTIKVDCLGRHNFTFPITQENINEREITLYFYIDVETESGDDRDVSDEMKTDEFGKLEITLPHFNSRFVASTTGGEASLVVDFINQSNGSPGAISSYHWDFGNGQTSLEASPSHTYTTPGTKNITLTATSSWGEVKTAIATIEVVVSASAGLSAPTNFRITAP